MSQAQHGKTGKWSEPGVPHRGWICVDVEDLGEPAQICEMCENVEIRYVHLMEHKEYSQRLGVGCICAQHMEEDYVNPRKRENRLKQKLRKRKFLSEKEWHVSRSGNYYINKEGFNVVIFYDNEKSNKWKIQVKHRKSGLRRIGSKSYSDVDSAKKAATGAVRWAKENLVT